LTDEEIALAQVKKQSSKGSSRTGSLAQSPELRTTDVESSAMLLTATSGSSMDSFSGGYGAQGAATDMDDSEPPSLHDTPAMSGSMGGSRTITPWM